jgi:glutamine---fructose-6-phosphate transaminase (isomerizing)
MCGIIGYIGKRPAVKILLQGLKKMEYRGYDSAGLCLVENNKLINIKRKGEIVELEQALNTEKTINSLSNIGIAHTRWATHGVPSEANSHPHLDSQENIAIVHNGIVENYDSLKKMLAKEGVKFKSETDSEIIAHLISKFYQDNLLQAVTKAINLIEGSYGLAVIDKKANKIIAARLSSPLVIGIGEREVLVASDPLAIMEYTRKIIYLKDNEIAEISLNDCKLQNIYGSKKDFEIVELKTKVSAIEKNNFKHFMLKEIFEQPQSLKNLIAGRLRKEEIKLSINLPQQAWRRLVLSACGTSWHSCLIAKYILEKHLDIIVEVDYASELRYRFNNINYQDLFIAISQSGETADTLAVLKLAKNKGAHVLGIINVVGSSIALEVDSGIYLHAGPEIGVASTKAFNSQVLALILFSLYLKQETENINKEKELIVEISKISSKVKKTLNLDKRIKEIAKKYYKSNNFLFLGRGINFPVALEGALKLKEISYIHAEAYPAAEIKHGPIALVDENMPVLFIVNEDDLLEKVISNIEEVKARGAKIIIVSDSNNQKLQKLADDYLKVEKTKWELSSIINSIPLQLLAYHIADLRKINVDKPRNLAKSVTVE